MNDFNLTEIIAALSSVFISLFIVLSVVFFGKTSQFFKNFHFSKEVEVNFLALKKEKLGTKSICSEVSWEKLWWPIRSPNNRRK